MVKIEEVVETAEEVVSPFVTPGVVEAVAVGDAASAETTTTGSQLTEVDHTSVHNSSGADPYGTSIKPTFGSSDQYKSCSMKVGVQDANLEKMVYLLDFPWTNGHNGFRLLKDFDPLWHILEDENHPAHGQMRNFSMYRAGYRLKFTVASSVGYIGALLFVWVPPGYATYVKHDNIDRSTLFNLPHTILNISENHVANLVVPYMSYKNYHDIWKFPDQDQTGGTVQVWVLSQLKRPNGATGSLTVTVYCALTDLDLQCPRPVGKFGDESPMKPRYSNVNAYGPGTRIQPGYGALSAADGDAFRGATSMAVGDDDYAIDYCTAGTEQEIRSVTDITSRWSFVAAVNVLPSRAARDELWSREVNFTMNANFRLLQNFGQWRGSLQFKLLILCPKVIQAKVQLSWYRREFEGFDFHKSRNSYQAVTDAHGPTTVLTVPFTNSSWKASTYENYGRLKLFLANPMAQSSLSAGQMDILIFARTGEDFKVYCPISSDYYYKNMGVEENLDDVKPKLYLNFEPLKNHIHKEDHSLFKNLFVRPWYAHSFTGPRFQKVDLTIPADTLISMIRCCAYWCGELCLTICTHDNTAVVAHR